MNLNNATWVPISTPTDPTLVESPELEGGEVVSYLFVETELWTRFTENNVTMVSTMEKEPVTVPTSAH